ncbi:MAG: hypothetical protein K2M31_07805 [Muribaculaceae bacterium]|nr:hypothetical protein [Muribaculaceae bacterium]
MHNISGIPYIDNEGPTSLIDMIEPVGPDCLNIDLKQKEKGKLSIDEIFTKGKRKKWNEDAADEARCDFIDNRHGIFFIKNFLYHSIWRKSVMGPTLKEIKAIPEMQEKFADNVAKLIRSSIGSNLDPKQFAIITAPKRRHKEHNFASLTAAKISEKLGIPFFEDVCFYNSKQRVNAVFSVAESLPPQKNLIVFDDIVTTGSTLNSIYNLFAPMGYNLSFFVGIKNS